MPGALRPSMNFSRPCVASSRRRQGSPLCPSPRHEYLPPLCPSDTASAGFAMVRMEPHLGPLQRAEGHVPHPQGEIVVKLERAGAGVKAEITLPEGVTGAFVWGGKSQPLHA